MKLPAGHASQALSLSVNPAMHLQVALPSSDSMLAPHDAQEDEPAGEYLSFAHDKQEVDGETVVPSAQKVHSDIDVAPAVGMYLPPGQASHSSVVFVIGHAEQFDAPTVAAYLPTSHIEHEADEVAPSDGEYLPTPQLIHPNPLLLLVLVENFPAGHSRHAAESSLA